MRKTIKLKKTEIEEIDVMSQRKVIAYHGIKMAHKIHYEARREMWRVISDFYPVVKYNHTATYHDGIITYTPEQERPK